MGAGTGHGRWHAGAQAYVLQSTERTASPQASPPPDPQVLGMSSAMKRCMICPDGERDAPQVVLVQVVELPAWPVSDGTNLLPTHPMAQELHLPPHKVTFFRM